MRVDNRQVASLDIFHTLTAHQLHARFKLRLQN
jgi:hypothetical protein